MTVSIQIRGACLRCTALLLNGVIVCLIGMFSVNCPVYAGPEASTQHASPLLSVSRPQRTKRIDQEVEDAIRQGRLTLEIRKLEVCEPFQDERRMLHRALDGIIRRYVAAGGSDDAYVTKRFYYDAGEVIALAVISATAVNGTQYQYRLRFDAKGRKLTERRMRIKGPGYPFPDVWPEEEIVRHPRDAFLADNLCGGNAR